jgi:hypothetical protein
VEKKLIFKRIPRDNECWTNIGTIGGDTSDQCDALACPGDWIVNPSVRQVRWHEATRVPRIRPCLVPHLISCSTRNELGCRTRSRRDPRSTRGYHPTDIRPPLIHQRYGTGLQPGVTDKNATESIQENLLIKPFSGYSANFGESQWVSVVKCVEDSGPKLVDFRPPLIHRICGTELQPG